MIKGILLIAFPAIMSLWCFRYVNAEFKDLDEIKIWFLIGIAAAGLVSSLTIAYQVFTMGADATFRALLDSMANG